MGGRQHLQVHQDLDGHARSAAAPRLVHQALGRLMSSRVMASVVSTCARTRTGLHDPRHPRARTHASLALSDSQTDDVKDRSLKAPVRAMQKPSRGVTHIAATISADMLMCPCAHVLMPSIRHALYKWLLRHGLSEGRIRTSVSRRTLGQQQRFRMSAHSLFFERVTTVTAHLAPDVSITSCCCCCCCSQGAAAPAASKTSVLLGCFTHAHTHTRARLRWATQQRTRRRQQRLAQLMPPTTQIHTALRCVRVCARPVHSNKQPRIVDSTELMQIRTTQQSRLQRTVCDGQSTA